MSFPPLTAPFSAPATASRSSEQFSQELNALVDEIQRTRDWFNAQIEAQLSSLNQLRSSVQPEEPTISVPMASLFQAPRPVEAAAPVAPVPEAPVPVTLAPEAPPMVPALPVHQAIIMPPTSIMAIDPELEQATLRELNDALSRAFSEISTRGGMLG